MAQLKKPMKQKKLTGLLNNYYLVAVNKPQRVNQKPYMAECDDIISALGLSFEEGCVFKAIWRKANARKGNGKPNYSPLYDAEKIMHYGRRIHEQESCNDN